MATSVITLPADTWVQVTTTDKSGTIFHQAGNNPVSYTETSVIPTGDSADTPISGVSQFGESKDYFGVATSEFIFAYSEGGDSKLSVTPVGE